MTRRTWQQRQRVQRTGLAPLAGDPSEPATAGQLATLQTLGKRPRKGITRMEAAALISDVAGGKQ